MFKKILAVSLSLSIWGSLMSGCGPANTSKKTGETKTAQKEELITYKWMACEHPNQPFSNDFPVFKKLEEKTNVKIEFEAVPMANFLDKLKILMAANQMVDISSINGVDYKSAGLNGLLLPVSDYLDKFPNLKKMYSVPDAKILKAADGKQYALDSYIENVYTEGWLVRKDIMDKMGVKELKTTDDWYNFLKSYKQQNPNSYPLISRGRPGTTYLRQVIGYSFGLRGDWNEVDGKLVYNPVTEQYKEMITWLNKLYSEKLFDPESIGLASKSWEERIVKGNSIATVDWISRTDSFTNSGKENNPQFNMIAVAPPKGPKGLSGTKVSYVFNDTDGAILSSKIKSPERALKFFDYMASDEGRILMNYGIEGSTYAMKDGKPEYTDAVLKAKDPQAERAKSGARLNFSFFYNPLEAEMKLMLPNTKEGIKIYSDPQLATKPQPSVAYNEKEQEIINSKFKPMETKMNTWVDKFISGAAPLSDWDKYVEDMKKMGLEDCVKIQNDAFARMK